MMMRTLGLGLAIMVACGMWGASPTRAADHLPPVRGHVTVHPHPVHVAPHVVRKVHAFPEFEVRPHTLVFPGHPVIEPFLDKYHLKPPISDVSTSTVDAVYKANGFAIEMKEASVEKFRDEARRYLVEAMICAPLYEEFTNRLLSQQQFEHMIARTSFRGGYRIPSAHMSRLISLNRAIVFDLAMDTGRSTEGLYRQFFSEACDDTLHRWSS